jgi:hypothetical protein
MGWMEEVSSLFGSKPDAVPKSVARVPRSLMSPVAVSPSQNPVMSQLMGIGQKNYSPGGEFMGGMGPVTKSTFDESPFAKAGTGNEGPLGKWTGYADYGLQGAEIGLGIFNALEQKKVNKFMQSYYENQMKTGKLDFNNAVQAANLGLQGKTERELDARGILAGTQESKDAIAATMNEWGAKSLA